MSRRSVRPPTTLVLVTVLVGLSTSRLFAQDPVPFSEYDVRVFGTADGLPVQEVRDVEQGADGYLYVATSRGLVRYDGLGFTPVDLGETFRSVIVDELFTDAEGRLWILSAELDIGVLDRGRIIPLGRPGGSPTVPGSDNGRSSSDFFQTDDGTVWLSGTRGLIRLGLDPVSITRFNRGHGLPSDTVVGIFDRPSGVRVVVTGRGVAKIVADPASPGGLRFDSLGITYPPLIAEPHVARSDARGLWILLPDMSVMRVQGTQVTRFAPGGGTRLTVDSMAWAPGDDGYAPGLTFPCANGVARSTARSLVTDEGEIWISAGCWSVGTDAMLLRKRGASIQEISLAGIDPGVILSLELDHQESLWVGADVGLIQLVPRRVFPLRPGHPLREVFTTALLAEDDGSVWVATWGDGLYRLRDGRVERRYDVDDGLPDDRVRSLHRTNDGALWVGTRSGVATVRGDVVHSVLATMEVRDFAGADADSLWVGTEEDLFRRVGPEWIEYPRPHGGSWWIWDLELHPDEGLWIATGRGLHRFASGRFRTFGPEDGIDSDFLVGLHRDATGTLWVASYEDGIFRYQDRRFMGAVTEAEGLHSNGIWAMVEDEAGGVWMPSDQGLAWVELERLHAVSSAVARGERPDPPLDPVVFRESEGMPTAESNRASAGGVRERSGRITINNRAGIVSADPVRALRPAPPAPTVLDSVLVDGQNRGLLEGEGDIGPAPRQISFHFTGLDFAHPDRTRYRYRLDGYDDDWITGGDRRQASYTNLPPKRYVFRVQAMSGPEGVAGPAASISLEIPPLPWQTWWFRFLAFGVLVGGVLLAHRARMRRVVEIERLRMGIAADLHDEVGSSLSSIALLSEMLKDRPGLEGQESRQLERIRQAALDTLGSLRDVIWLVDPRHDDVSALLRRMQRFAADLLRNVDHAFKRPITAPDVKLDPALQRDIYLIFKETLHNVVRHADADHVDIEVRVHERRFEMRIRDDGVGFRLGTGEGGYGLASLRRRARRMGGELDVRSAPGEGTEVSLRVGIP
jgi:signal transduction histidine kinase